MSMFRRKLLIIFVALFTLFMLPANTLALNHSYTDRLSKLTDAKVENDKVNIYFFYGEGCPHCAKENEFLDELEEKNKDYINIYRYETWYNAVNADMMDSAKKEFSSTSRGVPFTVIGDNYISGYNDYTKTKIVNMLNGYLGKGVIKADTDTDKTKDYVDEKDNNKNKYNLPIIGNVDAKKVSLPIVTIILGIVDGFNPCAMWVLLFLINILIGLNDRKKMFILGFAFLFTSGLVYFLSMLGINFALSMTGVTWIRRLIAIVAIIAGILNIRTYIKTLKDDGCHVIDDKKRKTMFSKIKKFSTADNMIIALVGIIGLAASVNLVELACSLGFPAIFAEILALNKVTGIYRIIYLLIYTLFYMLDDIIVFTIAVITFNLKGISTKFGKYSNLIGGAIMIIIGLLLILKPEWIMFNF